MYVGHAYEEIGSTQINTTSALENGETSAISRSLKFCLGDVDISNEIASAEEVATAINKQEGGYKMKSPNTTSTDPATEKQIYYIEKLNKEKRVFSDEQMKTELKDVTKERASQLIDALQNAAKDEDIKSSSVEEVEDQFA